MISFEQVLARAGFEPAHAPEVPGADLRNSYWHQVDGQACASIEYGPRKDTPRDGWPGPWPRLGVSLDAGKYCDIQVVRIVGSWSNPVAAALELPGALKQAYQAAGIAA